nr:hypothetical protein [Streptomyces fuscichromogenes]
MVSRFAHWDSPMASRVRGRSPSRKVAAESRTACPACEKMSYE